jgi:hypothetical protein
VAAAPVGAPSVAEPAAGGSDQAAEPPDCRTPVAL